MDFDRLNAGIRNLGELLAAPHLDPDRSRDDWSQRTADVEEVRRIVHDEVLAPAELLISEIADMEQQQQGRQVVAELCGNAAAVLFAAGRDDEARGLLARSQRMVQEAPGAEVYEAGTTDMESFAAFVRAWWLLDHDRRDEARSLAKQAKEHSPDAIAAELQRLLDAPRPLSSAPSLFSLNGFGLRIYGRRDPRPNGLYTGTRYLTALWIPILPIDSFLVRDEEDSSWTFFGKVRLAGFQRAWRGLVVAAVVLAVGWGAWNQYLHSTGRQVQVATAQAQATESTGDDAAALEEYENLLNQWASEATTDMLQPALDGFVRLVFAGIDDPMTIEQFSPAIRAVRRFEALPPSVRGAGVAPVSAKLATWADQLPTDAEAGLTGALGLLDTAVRIDDGTGSAALRSRRTVLRRQLADRLAAEWPIEALRQYADLDDDPEAIGLAAKIFETLGPGPSVWIELAPVTREWIASAERRQYDRAQEVGTLLLARVASAETHMASEERRTLLETSNPGALAAFLRKHPGDHGVAAALAESQRARGNPQAAQQTLAALGGPGQMVPAARFVLASVYGDLGREADAEALLERTLSTRLSAFEDARRRFYTRADQIREDVSHKAEIGNIPPAILTRLQQADEAEQGTIFGEWLDGAMEGDSQFRQLRDEYMALSDVVPAALHLGMLKLRRANAATGAERESLLLDTERVFLSIQGEAQGVVSYHLGLGQLYHRLGKTDPGEAEFASLLSRKDDSTALAVARAYRELGLEARAREVSEQVYERAVSPFKQQAAAILALLANEQDDRKRWLLQADQSDPFVRYSLLEIDAEEARERGDYQAAAESYGQVAASYERDADSNSSAANNASLARMRQYACTGRLEHLDGAVRLLKQARRLEPDNALVVGNLAYLLSYRAGIRVLESWIRTDPLRLESQEVNRLIAYLTEGSARTALLEAIRTAGDFRESLELAAQSEVLAPSRPASYMIQAGWHRQNRDAEGLARVAERIRRVESLDTGAREQFREDYVSRARIDEERKSNDETIARARRRVEEVAAQQHDPTSAAALVFEAGSLLERAELDSDADSASEAAALFERADRLWPALAAHEGLWQALRTAALLRAAEDNEAIRRAWEADSRRLGHSLIIHELIERGDPAALAALRSQDELARSVEFRKRAPTASLGMADWVLGRLVGDSELEAGGRAGMSRPDRIANEQLNLLLDPSSEAVRLSLALKRGD